MGIKQEIVKGFTISNLELAARWQHMAEEYASEGNEKGAERFRNMSRGELEKAEETFAKYPELDRSEIEARAAEQFAKWLDPRAAKAQRKAEAQEAKAQRKAETPEERKQRKAEEKAQRRAEREAKQEEKILDAQTRPVRQGRRRAEIGSYRLSRKQVKTLPAWVKVDLDAEAQAKATWEDAPGLTKPQRVYKNRCKEEYLARSEAAKEAHQYLASLEKKGLGVGGAVASIGISSVLFF